MMSTTQSTQDIRKEELQKLKDRKLYFKEKIEALVPQVELMELRARLGKATLEQFHYSVEINKLENGYENPPAPVHTTEMANPDTTTPLAKIIAMNPVTTTDAYQHTVTQDDITNNPELIDHGIIAGDVIGIPMDAFTNKENTAYEGTGHE